jgi:chorismate lyase/3-hydroxybenzoate synthase
LSKSSKERLCVRYQPALVDSNAQDHGGNLLGGIRIAMDEGGDSMGFCCVQTPMECLGGAQYAQQCWSVDGPVTTGFSVESDGVEVTWALTEDFIFARVSLTGESLERQSFLAYKALLAVLTSQCKPHLLRIWNFIPRINAHEAGVECYQLFNTGRSKAFGAMGYTLNDGAPAACALGLREGSLNVAILASTRPAAAIENPRQISSYNYPEQYGVNAPIFSRAAWWPQPAGDDLLFISGTASIVGHQTMHHGDVLAQLKESVRNIQSVLDSANQRAQATLWSLGDLQGRVYIRHAQDYPLVHGYLASVGLTQFCFVQADICRSDLLVEIEAEGRHAHAV